MANEILEAARNEAEALQKALSANPDYIKLQQIMKLIQVYESLDNKDEPNPLHRPRERVRFADLPTYRAGSKAQRVDEVVGNHLRKIGVRASSGDLLPVVEAAGIQLGGETPSRTLASFLTNSKLFNNIKGFGYGLAEWGETLGPQNSENSLWERDNAATNNQGQE
jgi:hypothetical protein